MNGKQKEIIPTTNQLCENMFTHPGPWSCESNGEFQRFMGSLLSSKFPFSSQVTRLDNSFATKNDLFDISFTRYQQHINIYLSTV